MDSLETLAKADKGFGSTSVLALILAGYMGLAGTAFWAFNKRSNDALESSMQSSPALICDCQFQKPASCPATNTQPSAKNTML